MSIKTLYENNKLDFWFIPLFLIFGITIQFICYKTHNDSLLSLVSGISGLFAVVLCASKRMSMYIFSFIQLFTYVILAYQQHLYGEIAENIFYFVMLIWGLFVWNKAYNKEQLEVESKQLTVRQNIILGTVVGFIILSLWRILSYTNDSQPFMDSITTVPAFIAQILLTLRYREQWIYWLIIDVGSIVMWGIAGDYIMMTQFIFWTINCFYGLYKWKIKNYE